MPSAEHRHKLSKTIQTVLLRYFRDGIDIPDTVIAHIHGLSEEFGDNQLDEIMMTEEEIAMQLK